MTTLHNRATPAQHRIMRAVEGAVRNVATVHPGWITNQRAPGSIAKRAAGTISAMWPGLLAEAGFPRPKSDVGRRVKDAAIHNGSAETRSAAPVADAVILWPAPAGEAQTARLGLPKRRWAKLIGRIGVMARAAKHAGQDERHAALVDVLRLMARMEGRP